MEAFIFTYDYVIMGRKVDDTNSTCLFAYLNREARSAYPSNFITGWSLTEEGKSFKPVCEWLDNRYAKTVDLDELIRIAMNARLDKEELVKFPTVLDEFYNKAGINKKTKYGMLRR